jgi:hypothetical protein
MSVTIKGRIYPIATTTRIVLRPPNRDGWEREHLVLPENIGDLTNLTTLDIGFCQAKRIPESIGNLRNLEILKVNDSNLTTLPESIGNLTNLKELNLYMNKLTSLPETIGSLIDLRILNLSYNTRLREIPYSIGRLPNLKKLEISETAFARNTGLEYATTNSIKDFLKMKLKEVEKQELIKMKTAIVSALKGTPMNHDNIVKSIDIAFPNVVDKEGVKITARDMLNEYLNKFATQEGGDIYGKYLVGKSSFKFKRLSRKVSKRKTSKRKSKKASRTASRKRQHLVMLFL